MLDQVVGVNDPTALAVVLTDVNSQFTIENGTAALATNWQIELPGGPGRLADQ